MVKEWDLILKEPKINEFFENRNWKTTINISAFCWSCICNIFSPQYSTFYTCKEWTDFFFINDGQKKTKSEVILSSHFATLKLYWEPTGYEIKIQLKKGFQPQCNFKNLLAPPCMVTINCRSWPKVSVQLIGRITVAPATASIFAPTFHYHFFGWCAKTESKSNFNWK